MSVVDPGQFAPQLSEAEVWNVINMLPVSYQDFAEMTYYYNRMYDVLTGSLDGPGKWDDLTVNECFRSSLWRKLEEVTEKTERRMGFNFSKRYHYEDIPYPRNGKGQTVWPGVTSVNKRPLWTTLAQYSAVAISPIAVDPATVNNPGVQPIVLADTSMFQNPADVQMRNADTLNTYTPLRLAGYPKRTGSNWEIPIDTKLSSFDAGADTVLQHKKYLFLDLDAPTVGTVPAGSVVYPVYPGTNQIIPEAKPRELLGNGKTRYTFFVYSLVHPAFYYETVNLLQGEFYKLYPEIQFKALGESTTPAQIVWTRGGEEELVDVEVRIVDPAKGIYHVIIDEDVLCNPCELWADEFEDCCKQWTPETIHLRFYYKTDPVIVENLYSRQITTLRQAIVHRVAAELPVLDCGCRVTAGFIYENQQRYDRITMKQFTGVEIRSSDYADMKGRLEYESLLSNLFTFQTLVLL